MTKTKDRIIAVLLTVFVVMTLFVNYEGNWVHAEEAINSTQEFQDRFVAEALARVGNKYETGKGHTDANSASFDCGGLIGSVFTSMGFSKGFDGESWGYWGPEYL